MSTDTPLFGETIHASSPPFGPRRLPPVRCPTSVTTPLSCTRLAKENPADLLTSPTSRAAGFTVRGEDDIESIEGIRTLSRSHQLVRSHDDLHDHLALPRPRHPQHPEVVDTGREDRWIEGHPDGDLPR